MFIFLALAFAGFLPLVISLVFSHDVDHDVSHDHGGIFHFGHDGGHDITHAEQYTISIFSTKVIFTFLMGFGAAGAVATYYKANYMLASGCGVGLGIILGLVMFAVLKLISGQQSTSIVPSAALVNLIGTVTTSIDGSSNGEIGVTANGIYQSFLAHSADGSSISKGASVKIVSVAGTGVSVEKA